MNMDNAAHVATCHSWATWLVQTRGMYAVMTRALCCDLPFMTELGCNVRDIFCVISEIFFNGGTKTFMGWLIGKIHLCGGCLEFIFSVLELLQAQAHPVRHAYLLQHV